MLSSRFVRHSLSVIICLLAPQAFASQIDGRPTITDLGDMRFRITFRSEDLRQGVVVIDGDEYDTFDFVDAGHLRGAEHVGAPDLPYVSLSALIPPRTQVASVDTLSATVVTLPGTYLPAPIQPEHDPRNPLPPVPPDQEIYGSIRPYPAELGQRAFDGSMRGYHIGVSRVYPIRYIGATQRIQVITSLEIRINLEPYDEVSRGGLVQRSPIRLRNTLFGDEVSWIVRTVANADDIPIMYPIPIEREQAGVRTPHAGFQPTDRPADAGPPVHYVIITDSTSIDGVKVGNLVAEFQRLADWKTKKGMPAVVRTVKWIHENYDGDDLQEEIRNFIIDAYKQWGTDWVLLGGDVEIVPDRWFGDNSIHNDLLASVYYGGLDGTWNSDGDEYYNWFSHADPFWDVWVGRLPVDQATQAKSVIDKIFTYERIPGFPAAIPDTTYYNKFIALTGAVNDTTWGRDQCGFYTAEDVIRRMVVPAGLNPVRLYEGVLDPSDLTCMPRIKLELFSGGNPIFDTWGPGESRDRLQEGFGFVYHYEHSTVEFIGGPSRCAGCPPAYDRCDLPNPISEGHFYGEGAAGLTNGPKYSIMLSRGSQVNEHEIDSVSERFMLNPSGGAVAFLGKSRSSEDRSSAFVDTLFFKELFVHKVSLLGQSYAFATQKSVTMLAEPDQRSLAHWNLLGDPEMRAWTAVPKPLTLTVTPTVIEVALPMRIRVTVRDSTTSALLDSALVCLKQGTDAYAFNLTDASGVAEFDFHPVNVDTTITITATATNHIAKQASIGFSPGLSAAHNVVYENHEPTQVTGNGKNGIEAGEQWKLKVTVKNIGNFDSPDVAGKLRIVGPITMTLRMDGVYDPQKIYIGKFGSHPPRSLSDTTFTLPSLRWNGINPYGKPSLLDSSLTGFFVWRDTTVTGPDWRLVWKQTSGSSTKFTGTIVALGEFMNAASSGFEAGDSLWSTATKLTFKTFSASGDRDSLLFNARESKWATVVDSLVNYGVIGDGETAGGVNGDTFEVKLKPELPDRHTFVFEIVVGSEVGAVNTSTSEFILATGAPVFAQRRQDLSKSSGELRLLPTIRNSGTAYADSVVARLSITVNDSLDFVSNVLSLGEIAPLSEVTASSPFRFTVAGADTNYGAMRFRLDLTNYFKSGDTLRVTQTDIDIQRPSAPTLASLDPTQTGMWAIWNHSSPPADLRGYNVYRDSVRVNPALVEAARRFFIADLVPQTPYDIVVTAQDLSGNESKWPANNVSQTTALSIPTGWPKSVGGHTRGNMQPTVADVDNDGRREVIVGSQDVYAWHLDNGTELINGDSNANTDGIFYMTPDSLKASRMGFEIIWAAPFAVADIDSTPDGVSKEIVGVTSPAPGDSSRVVVWNANGTIRWVARIPRVPSYLSPVIANLDSEQAKEILLIADGASTPGPRALYVWNHDKTPYGSDVKFVTGLPSNQVNSPAVGDITTSLGMEIAIGRADSGKVDVYKSTDGSLAWRWYPTGLGMGCNRLYRGSTPVLGDVDADGKLNLVVALQTPEVSPGWDTDAIFAIDENGATLAGYLPGNCASGALRLAVDPNPGVNHVAPPSLGNLDQDSRLEVVVAGRLLGDSPGLRNHGIALDLVGSAFVATVVPDSIPRRHETQPFGEGPFLPFGEPVIADIDGDGNLDGIYTTPLGGVFAFGPSTGGPRPGWPIQVTESIVGAPVVGSLSNRGKFDLLVLDRGGTLHLFHSTADSTSKVEWAQFGANPAHTFLYQGGGGGYLTDGGTEPTAILGQNIPNPFNPETRVAFRIPRRERVELNVFSVSGRHVRRLVDEVLEPGVHESRWDGRNEEGQSVPSGVYFYELGVGTTRASRKMLLLR